MFFKLSQKASAMLLLQIMRFFICVKNAIHQTVGFVCGNLHILYIDTNCRPVTFSHRPSLSHFSCTCPSTMYKKFYLMTHQPSHSEQSLTGQYACTLLQHHSILGIFQRIHRIFLVSSSQTPSSGRFSYILILVADLKLSKISSIRKILLVLGLANCHETQGMRAIVFGGEAFQQDTRSK